SPTSSPTSGDSQTGSSSTTGDSASSTGASSDATAPTGSTGHGTGTSDTGALTCDDARDEVSFFLNKNSPCTDDADCVTVDAACWEQPQDCCVIYLNKTYDPPTWLDVYGQYQALCGLEQCGCCAKVPNEPACVDGFCGPSQG
ncbi:MAG: hypothetical protein KC468_08870, partial [Myxococcales bacterium]|nr:hypothetical protein [Myxococcales bacterium]